MQSNSLKGQGLSWFDSAQDMISFIVQVKVCLYRKYLILLYVLTDSFHATAFSLNLHTEPICVYPKEFGGRLGSILKQTHSTQRHIENYNDFDVVNRPVDFEEVESILCRERDKANNFIESVIADIAEFNRRKEEKSNENSLPQK